MFGLIVKLTAASGKREEMIAILRESAAGMPGCFAYVVAEDSSDDNAIWVTEVWESESAHDASLLLPAARSAIPLAKQIVTGFEKIAVTRPVWGSRARITSQQLSDFQDKLSQKNIVTC